MAESDYIAGQRALSARIVDVLDLPDKETLSRWREVEAKVEELWKMVFPGEPFDHQLHLADSLERIGDAVDELTAPTEDK